jgi:hypothetical protein
MRNSQTTLRHISGDNLPGQKRNIIVCYLSYPHAVVQYLRRYATSRKVAGSRPDEVNEFFQFT